MTKKIKEILGEYLSTEENKLLEAVLNSDTISEMVIGKILNPKLAKEIAEIIYINRKELQDNMTAISLHKSCSDYYENSLSGNLILGKGSLEPHSMCDLKSVGPVIYESIH